EEKGGEDEDRDREEAGRGEELTPDDAAAPEDARDVDGEAGAIARPLSVVPFDLAAEVGEDGGAGGDDEESEEADAGREPAAEHGAGDEMEKREDDDLLVVRCAASGGEADDLEERGELDGDVEGRRVPGEAHELADEEGQRADGRDVAEERAVLPALRHREGE